MQLSRAYLKAGLYLNWIFATLSAGRICKGKQAHMIEHVFFFSLSKLYLIISVMYTTCITILHMLLWEGFVFLLLYI